jgi:hypothetical protein
MSLVRVWTDVGARKPVALLAKIVEKDGVIFTIRYLSECEDKIWRYEEDTYEIDDDSIAEHLNADHEEDIGFAQAEDGFVKLMGEEDEDYVPSDEEDSVESSEEEEEDEDFEEEFDESADEEEDED